MCVRVVLDTCAVRNHIHGNGSLPVEEIRRYPNEVRVSIHDVAFSEFIIDLNDGHVNWTDWLDVAADFRAMIDPEFPVLLSGRDLATLAGLVESEAEDDQLPPHDISFTSWRFLLNAQRPEDLGRERVVRTTDNVEMKVCLNIDAARDHIEQSREFWAEYIDAISALPGEVTRLEILKLLEGAITGRYGEVLDELRPSLQLLSHYIDIARHNYNPESDKRKNDYLDFQILFSLALGNAVICTEDKRMHSTLKFVKAPEARRVISIEELKRRLGEKTLSELIS